MEMHDEQMYMNEESMVGLLLPQDGRGLTGKLLLY